MTEAEWLACDDPDAALAFLRDKGSARKVRLFAIACVRRVWSLLTDDRARTAVETAERFADGLAPAAELERVRGAAHASHPILTAATPRGYAFQSACECAARDGQQDHQSRAALQILVLRAVVLAEEAESRLTQFLSPTDAPIVAVGAAARETRPIRRRLSGEAQRAFVRRAHAHLIRDIFGNPFRPITFTLEWRTDTVAAIAQGMYESRDFGAMPILADALQDAGCDNADVLSHCRDPNHVHVRGCWVVDLVLGKE